MAVHQYRGWVGARPQDRPVDGQQVACCRLDTEASEGLGDSAAGGGSDQTTLDGHGDRGARQEQPAVDRDEHCSGKPQQHLGAAGQPNPSQYGRWGEQPQAVAVATARQWLL
jgi:hypothetical protein